MRGVYLRNRRKHTAIFVILLLVMLLSVESINAQVAGVSASKLTAIDATLVSAKTLEVEPSFAYLYSKKYFDNNGNLFPVSLDSDSTVILKEMFFRFTYGVGSRLEVGTFITGSLKTVSFAAKYRFVQHKKFLAVALLGVTFSGESDFGLRKTGFYGEYMAVASGVALTNNFTPRLSLDVTAQYQNSFCDEGSLSDNYFLDSDLGYYVYNHTLQIVGGFSFQYHYLKGVKPDAYLLSFHPGVTIETGKSFIIVIYTPIDLIGKNVNRFVGFSLAFTLTVD